MSLVLVLIVACTPEIASPDTGDASDPSPTGETAAPTDTAPPEEPTIPDEVAYVAHVEPLLAVRCGGCHMGGNTSGELDMDPGVDAFVDVPAVELPAMMRVSPGDPDASYVWHKVNGTHLEVGGSGDSMPTQFSLKDHELALIEAWILDGALP